MSKEWLKLQSHSLTYNLLDSDDFRRLLDNPKLLANEVRTSLSQLPHHEGEILSVLIDEVQKIPELLDICHLLIEENKGKVRFLLTGSSARKLKSKGANLLAGRAYNLRLHPLTLEELKKNNQSIDLISILKTGTIPGIIFEENPNLALRAYVDTYLKEEIQQEALVRKLDKFFRFLDLAAQLNGESINFSKFARQLSIADKTTADYFQILIDTLLVIQLPGWNRSIKKQVLKSPKFYFFDCGVLNAASGELNLTLSKGSPRFGRLFETMVINEFYRINLYRQLDFSLSYYSTGQSEVDLILSRGKEEPIAIEIKSNANIHKEDLNGLEVFSIEYPKSKLYCVSTNDKMQTVKLTNGKEVLVIPYLEATNKILLPTGS
jgi:predicted AAA+ superfamily ATPase